MGGFLRVILFVYLGALFVWWFLCSGGFFWLVVFWGLVGWFGVFSPDQSGVHYFRDHGTASGYSYRVDFK